MQKHWKDERKNVLSEILYVVIVHMSVNLLEHQKYGTIQA